MCRVTFLIATLLLTGCANPGARHVTQSSDSPPHVIQSSDSSADAVSIYAPQGPTDAVMKMAVSYCKQQGKLVDWSHNHGSGATLKYECVTSVVREARIHQESSFLLEIEQARRDAEARQMEAADNKTCVSYGFRKGTDGFAQCRLQLAQQRENQQAAAEQAALAEEANQQVAQANQQAAARAEEQRRAAQIDAVARALLPPAPTYSGPTHCNTTYMGITAQTNCY
jgi:hypothetical protein